MARLAYSKSSLSKETAELKRYRQYLPSLDLKRQQLAIERKKAQLLVEQGKIEIAECYQQSSVMLPMLADTSIDVKNLVNLKKIEFVEENIVGVHLPVIQHLEIEVKEYSLFSEPHWVDQLVIQLKEMLRLKVAQQVKEQRVEALNFALRKITQRVNLFDKVLIPKAQQNIRKIRIYLSDMETAAVVRAKSTKQKRLKISEAGL